MAQIFPSDIEAARLSGESSDELETLIARPIEWVIGCISMPLTRRMVSPCISMHLR